MLIGVVDQVVPTQGCPGKAMRMQGATAAICYGCARYGLASPHPIEPRAQLDPATSTWTCPDRLGSFAYCHEEGTR